MDENSKSVIMPTLFVFIGSVSIVLRRKRNGKDIGISRPSSLSRNIDILAIVFMSSFLYYIFLQHISKCFYPIAGTDASRHYNNSIILSRTPGLYNAFSYLLFQCERSHSTCFIWTSPEYSIFSNYSSSIEYIFAIICLRVSKKDSLLVSIEEYLPFQLYFIQF